MNYDKLSELINKLPDPKSDFESFYNSLDNIKKEANRLKMEQIKASIVDKKDKMLLDMSLGAIGITLKAEETRTKLATVKKETIDKIKKNINSTMSVSDDRLEEIRREIANLKDERESLIDGLRTSETISDSAIRI